MGAVDRSEVGMKYVVSWELRATASEEVLARS
jgi:hypothetical protein